MPKYISYWNEGEWEYDYYSPSSDNITVILTEADTFTGLLDAEGRELHRVKEPIGFIHRTT